MSKKEFYEKYCLYYKGEEKPPFEYGSAGYRFWNLERQYWDNGDFDHSTYEDRVKEYIKNNPDADNYITSDAPIERKGFVFFAEEMLDKWEPDAVNIVFEYGKE